MNLMSIGEVARQAEIRPSAIRYYEEIGLLPEANRVGGQRRYDEAILVRLSVIRAAQGLGFTIAELQELFARKSADLPVSERWHGLAERKLAELDRVIERAHRMREVLGESLRCGCMDFENCVLIQ